MRGEGGRAALERYSARLDALIGQLVVDAPPAGRQVAIAALGGYGRRHLCLHSDIDLLVLFDGRSATARSGSCARCCIRCGTSAWSSATRCGRSTSSPRLEADNPEFLLALLDARPIAGDAGALRRGSRTAFHSPQTHAFIVGALERLIDERHAQFNDTLYQLEPDVKDAPGALRDLTAVRTHRRADRSGAAAARDRRIPRGCDEAEDFLLRVRSILHLETQAQPERAEPRAAGAGRGRPRLPGPLPQQRVERLMGDYFRHARVVTARSSGRGGPRPMPVGAESRSRRATASGSSIAAGGAPAGDLARGVPGGDRRATATVADEALVVHPAARRALPRRRLLPDAGASRGAAALPEAARRASTRGCRRCTTAGCSAGCSREFQAITCRVVRDFYHKYTVDEHTLLTIRNLERLATPATPDRERFASLLARARGARAARAGAAAPRRRQVARRRPRDRERADGASRCSSACSSTAEAARDRRSS